MLQQAVENAVRRAGLARPMSCHTLRLSFATRLLEFVGSSWLKV